MPLTRLLSLLALILVLTPSVRAVEADNAPDDKTNPPPLPYATAHDQPLDVATRQTAQTATYTQFHVTFNGIRPGTRVPAFLYLPKQNEPKLQNEPAARRNEPTSPSKRPAVLLQYGSGGNKSTRYIVAVAQQAVARGFVVLTIDVPGRGERRHEKAADQRPLLFRDVSQTLGDYSRAVDYLASRDDVDVQRIAYVGISWGAITGVTFVAHDPRIKAIASLVGGGNFLGWLPGPLSDDARKAAERWDPVYHVARIAPRPVLLLNVTRDQLVPRFFGESLQNAAGPNADKKWLDTDHFFSTVDRHAVLEDVLDWVQSKLDAEGG